MKKKITKYMTAGMLSVSLLAGSFPLMENKAEAAVFSDTYKTAWAVPSIENLYKKGILKGTGEGTFSPSSSVTRAEFAAMLGRVVNKKAATSTFSFTDVSKKKWYYGAVKEAYQMGIVKGVSATRFAPDRPITREEAAAIIAHTFNYSHTSSALSYKDKGKVSSWAVNGVKAVTQKKIFGGDNGYFHPQKSLTRAEVAVVLHTIVYGPAPKPVTAPVKKVASRASDRMDELLARKVQPLLGTPYRFGGTTTAGFDCSGFTQYVYKSMGVNLPRTTGQQFTKGTAVSLKSMKPGDILFFDTGSGSISHNGIYMGNGKMAHAATGQGSVKINDLDWYIEHYRVVGVKRYL
ncbi:S-layer homology domain-containing protein [Aneurinibacillus sp. REN35]|uniref:S-layer homology domain-containing protein n=1 Tax=Aneurinibacillus sp. REN35 TaxID=3237286 RepID=UPI003529866A